MALHVWTIVMTSVPANALQVALLSEFGMCLREREPDLSLLIMAVIPLYLLIMYYCLITRRRGPIIYYWVFMLFMPLFNMCMGIYACCYPVNTFHRPAAGREIQTAPRSWRDGLAEVPVPRPPEIVTQGSFRPQP